MLKRYGGQLGPIRIQASERGSRHSNNNKGKEYERVCVYICILWRCPIGNLLLLLRVSGIMKSSGTLFNILFSSKKNSGIGDHLRKLPVPGSIFLSTLPRISSIK